MWNFKRHFYVEIVIGEIFANKEEFVVYICRFGESFYMVGFEETRLSRVFG